MTAETKPEPAQKKERKIPFTIPELELVRSGHVGCLGCGAVHAGRYVLKALGPQTVVSVPACCWAVMPGVWPRHNLEIAMQYTAFEVTGASISGIRAALDAKGMRDVPVLGFAGDGGTADIGLQSLSGMVERGTRAIYVMYDNEAYMNTGIQRSSSTPAGTWTTTTPASQGKGSKQVPKKNVMKIMIAHDIPYAATASIAYPEDMVRKVKRAAEIDGPSFIHIYAPCPTGWKSPPELTVELARQVVMTGVFPLYEYDHGVYRVNKKPRKLKPIRDYLANQGRFKGLSEEQIDAGQAQVRKDWERLLAMERFTAPEDQVATPV